MPRKRPSSPSGTPETSWCFHDPGGGSFLQKNWTEVFKNFGARMTRAVWDNLLAQAKAAHTGALADFCDFPDDLSEVPVAPHRIPVADLFENDPAFSGINGLGAAFLAGSPDATWRETYRGSQIAQDFLDRFGCYCLIGNGGAFASAQMGAFVVYMPTNLDYPWHHHPAEEMYVILAGGAEFECQGQPAKYLRAGEHVIHRSSEPHATRTLDEPLLAYVVWRNHFGIKPIWTEKALR